MTQAWFTLAGVVFGGVIANLGNFSIHRRTHVAAMRQERLNAYVDFITSANRGLRVVHQIMKSQKAKDAARDETNKGMPSKEYDRLYTAVTEFYGAMDRALSVMQLVAPMELVRLGTNLRERIDDHKDAGLTEADLLELFAKFVARAKVDLSDVKHDFHTSDFISNIER